MATTKFKGNEVHTNADLPVEGSQAPTLRLVGTDLKERTLDDFSGRKKVLTVNPSYDTAVCQAAARQFNTRAADHADAVVLMISKDLPFAHKRFCEAEGIDHVVPLSAFRAEFATDWGLELVDGPLAGLTARAVFVLDERDRILHCQLVDEITEEPNYDAALAALD